MATDNIKRPKIKKKLCQIFILTQHLLLMINLTEVIKRLTPIKLLLRLSLR